MVRTAATAAANAAPGVPEGRTKSLETILLAGRSKEYQVKVPSKDLTIRYIQDQIPSKYFERNTLRSLMYLARDLAQLAAVYAIMGWLGMPALDRFADAMHVSSGLPSAVAVPLVWVVRFAVWNVFWFVQGINGTAIWVLAHECGHQAFSPSRTLNDTLGLILHSATLVPYHSWRITHGTHHKHTNHLTKDSVFVPEKRETIMDMADQLPICMFFDMCRMFLFGWPAYLLFNVASQDYGRHANHFEPSSPLFRREDANDIVVSDLGILAVLFALGSAIYRYGFASVFCFYVAPYLWVNFWLLYITFLQHTDIRIPHYDHDNWTFVRGAIAAVDRNYGSVLNSWLHHINDSHVVHHLFSQMPFYNAIQVTRKHIREILGDTYIVDDTPLIESLVRTWVECRYVIPTDGVAVFRR